MDTPYLLSEGERLGRVKYLLTFRPFGQLPQEGAAGLSGGRFAPVAVSRKPRVLGRAAVSPIAARTAAWPCRFRCCTCFRGGKIPTVCGCRRRAGCTNRIPTIPTPDPTKVPLRNMFRRTHRWGRIHRHEDELGVADGEDHVAHVLFSTLPEDLGLYDKPMARNAQVWTHEFRLLLDGPRASREAILHAAAVLREGGLFGYRFQYPAMRVGQYEIYWHRPLVAYLSPKNRPAARSCVDGPLGYLTAYDADRPNPARAMELWPRLLARPAARGGDRGLLGDAGTS